VPVKFDAAEKPTETLPEVVRQLREVEDKALRKRLSTSMIALLNDKEMAQMVEQLLEEDGLLMDTPWLRKIRIQAREEAIVEGRAEGRAEGVRQSRQQDILNILKWRFDPTISMYEEVMHTLTVSTDVGQLETFLKLAIEVKKIEEFRTKLAELTKEA
jgi:hypothetical protein